MRDSKKSGTLLIISQVYPPDSPAVGQHIAEVAARMVRNGHRVVAFTSSRGYQDSSVKFPSRETIDGVEVIRLPFSSFGKRSFPIRTLAGILFVFQAVFRALWMHFDGILISTAPPFAPIATLLLKLLKRSRYTFWAMDLNPDQLVAMGTLPEKSFVVRIFNAINRLNLKHAFAVIVLDKVMGKRLNQKYELGDRLHVIPPGALKEAMNSVEHDENPFRKKHNLEGKFVIMYAGNHGFSTPVKPLVDAAIRMQDRDRLLFMFIGGGITKKDVTNAIDEHNPTNIISLPFQPLSEIKYSLSAADVHAVTILPVVVGALHPCKIYGAMAVQRPVLLIGPEESHVSNLVEEEGFGWRVDYGDVDRLVEVIDDILETDSAQLQAKGEKARRTLDERFSPDQLFGSITDILEKMMGKSS